MRNDFNQKSVDLDPVIYGKVPPNNRDLEEMVLGACMLEKDAIEIVTGLLLPECFYATENQLVYKAILELHNNGKPIDMIMVVEQMQKMGYMDKIESGPYYVTKLTNRVVSAANIEQHSQVILEKFLLREQIRICSQGLHDAYENSADAFECLDLLSKNLTQVSDYGMKSEGESITSLLIQTMQRLAELRKRTDHLTGITTGFKELDLLTAGWQETDLIIIAARPSVGKTAFALNLMRNAASYARKKTPVAFFSMEMSAPQLTNRLLSAESGIPLDLIIRAKLTDQHMKDLYNNGVQKLSEYPMHIDDTPALNIFQLRSRLRKLVKREKVGLAVIDYLQLMNGIGDKRNGNREQEISTISRGLKSLAKELRIPIIALSQLSRDIEKAKRDPQLSDLRESGAIEQDADMVMFLTRPDYQQYEGDQMVTDMADIHIKKHRNGSLEKIPMHTALNIQRWMAPGQYDMYKRNISNFKPVLHLMNDEENPF